MSNPDPKFNPENMKAEDDLSKKPPQSWRDDNFNDLLKRFLRACHIRGGLQKTGEVIPIDLDKDIVEMEYELKQRFTEVEQAAYEGGKGRCFTAL